MDVSVNHTKLEQTSHLRSRPLLASRADHAEDEQEKDEWAGDLRRRRHQEGVEKLVASARFLPTGERELIESVFRDGRRVSELARLISGLSRNAPSSPHAGASPPRPGVLARPGRAGRTLRYRVRRVVRRMLTPEYQAVARWMALEKLGSAASAWNGWGPTRRRVAICCGLHGLSLREAAADLNISLHTVRRHWDAVRALIDAGACAASARSERPA